VRVVVSLLLRHCVTTSHRAVQSCHRVIAWWGCNV
jgi:hypothetical protein